MRAPTWLLEMEFPHPLCPPLAVRAGYKTTSLGFSFLVGELVRRPIGSELLCSVRSGDGDGGAAGFLIANMRPRIEGIV